MCSFCFFQHDHSLRRYVSISTINSPEKTSVFALSVYCMCVFVWGHIALHRSNPTSAKRQIIRGRPEAFTEQLWMKLYPAQKSRKTEWHKKRGKKATACLKPQPGLSFMGKYFRKVWFHKKQTHRRRQYTQTRHFWNPQGRRHTHFVTSHAKMLIEQQMLLI